MPSYVIVGASRGLGYQYLKTLSADSSNTVIGLVRNVDETLAKVTADGLPNVHILHGDLTDAASLTTAAKAVAKITNSVDHLIVNGAYLPVNVVFLKPTDYIGQEKLFQDEMTACYNTNTIGVLYAINAFLPLVKASSIKKVIVISTGHADENIARITESSDAIPYALSKVAVNMLVVKYAIQFKNEGIIFLALSPGLVLTAAPSWEEAPEQIKAFYDAMKEPFRKFAPDHNGPILPVESVAAQLKVIENITIKDSGAFLSHKGDKNWLAGA